MGSPASSHIAGPLSLAGGHALGAHRDPLELKPSRQCYVGHNGRCPAIWMYASVPSWWDRGIPPNALSHNMHEVPLVLPSSFNEHNPVSRFHAYMSFSFSFRYISYIFIAGLCIMQFTVFHVIQFIQLHFNTHTTSHNRTRATHRPMHNISHQLSSINNIHSRSHDFVLKHNHLAYNVSYHNQVIT